MFLEQYFRMLEEHSEYSGGFRVQLVMPTVSPEETIYNNAKKGATYP
ncbi:hypothetical protein UF75_4966 [Desulfosporosinus sp. I2]|nr:hypothetical protein UF75_4966 [Desulfosporosinus sp. I2]